jgi:DNA-binding NarL/FixJ family response regulator
VSGEAGIGKTRLVNAFREAVLEHDPAVYVGQCYDTVSGAYVPFDDLLEDLRKRPARAETSTSAERPGGDSKIRYFRTVAEALRKRSARRPVILIIEDIQWADRATVELFAYLANNLRQAPVMLLTTMRQDAFDSRDVLAILAGLHRAGAIEIDLAGLEREKTRELIHRALQGHRMPSVELRRQIEEMSEGNPLYAEEMLRSAVDRLDDPEAPVRIPLTISAVVAQRLRAFEEAEIEMLRFAAVIGRRFNAIFLSKVTGAAYSDVLGILQKARAHQLIEELPGQPVPYVFRHTLIREALYAQLLTPVAHGMHDRVASVLEAEGEGSAAELAHHWDKAGREDKAVVYHERAGDSAVDLVACHDAAGFYRKALAAHPQGTSRARLYEKLGLALSIEGSFDEAGLCLNAAANEYRNLGDFDAVANVLLHIARQRWEESNTTESLHASQEAATLPLGSNSERILARARITHARFLITLADATAAAETLKLASGSLEDLDAPWQAQYYEVLGETLAALDDVEGFLSAFEEATRLANEAGNVDGLVRIENAYALSAVDLGLTDTAVAAHRRALSASGHANLIWRDAYTRLGAAGTSFLCGDLQRSRDLIRGALGQGLESSTLRTRAAAVGLRVAVLLDDKELIRDLSDVRAVEEAFRSGEPQRIGSVAAAFSLLYREQGKIDEATDLLRKALSRIDRLHRCWDFALEVAAFGDIADADALMRLINGRRSEANKAAAAFQNICAAYIEKRKGQAALSMTLAKAAAEGFKHLRWPTYEALAHELAGEPEEALALNLTIGSLKSARRQEKALMASREGEHVALTARQAQVAELVAEGCTNREIGKRLFISEHTVENHLAVMYERLGVRSRSQLAAYFSRTGQSEAKTS